MKTTTARNPMLLTPREAAETLAISPRTLWTRTNCGELPCVRIGRSVRYRPESLRDWLAEREQTGRQS